MKYDALPIACSIFSDRWPDFKFKKSKKTWARETNDRVLLLVQIQGSRWGAMYYLNFGAYFLDIEPIDKPLSNLPKPSDWHLFARYERFQELSTAEHNILFSLEENDSISLEDRCNEIAAFAEKRILSQLRIFGNLDLIRSQVSKKGSEIAFDPFNTQKIAKKDILNYVDEQSRLMSS